MSGHSLLVINVPIHSTKKMAYIDKVATFHLKRK